MYKQQLLDEENENEDNDDATLRINKNYAQNYENWRRKEEVQKCKKQKIPENFR